MEIEWAIIPVLFTPRPLKLLTVSVQEFSVERRKRMMVQGDIFFSASDD